MRAAEKGDGMAKNRDSGVTKTPEPDVNDGGRIPGIDDADSLSEIAKFMLDNYGVAVSRSMTQYSVDSLKTILKGVVEMMTKVPELKGILKTVGKDLQDGDGYAGIDFRGNLYVNPEVMKDMQTATKAYERDLSTSYHPEGTDVSNVIIHEMGHAMEIALIHKKYPRNLTKQLSAWRNGDVANDVVASAMDRAVPGWKADPRKAANAISDVSRYATQDASETIAEAVSDYRSNGRNAKPLSVAIWGELQNRLRS